MDKLAGYSINNLIYEDESTAVAEATSADKIPVLLKYQNTDFPTVDLDARWSHEFDILRSIDSEYVIQASEFYRHNNNPLLVLDYFPSTPLSELIKQNVLSFNQKLKVACQLALAIGDIHQQQLIHRGLTPGIILINPNTLQLKISDVGLASRLGRESRLSHRSLWGTLEYISPELTGRTNLDVDYRSDFYSIGVILYEMFHYHRPFRSEDPMALLHSHIASMPPALECIDRDFPHTLSEIIQKLLAKAPEDRYQSSYGLYADLQQCLEQSENLGTIENFDLAVRDVPEKLCISQLLYARGQEREVLLDAYQRVSDGGAELVLISGEAGVGKTELAQELYNPVLANSGLLITGKCDQYNQNQPYAVLIQAFRLLVEHLLSENTENQLHWKQKLNHVLGNNAAVMTKVIPDLVHILDDVPALEPLPTSESEQRLHLTFIDFVKALSTREQPLVLLLDDLQWVDQPTLKILEQLMLNGSCAALLVVGLYRSNEVNQQHAVSVWRESLIRSHHVFHELQLRALPVDSVQQMLIDTLQASDSDVTPLAALCYEKTGGNPFFLKQFLYGLYDKQDIYYDREAGRWQWDIQSIIQRNITANVVDFMVDKLHELDADIQRLISLASLLGGTFGLRMLATVHEQSVAETARALWPVLQQGLILPLNENYKFNDSPEKLILTQYRFLHDRVQQAAYTLIDQQVLPELMLKVGRLLLVEMTTDSTSKIPAADQAKSLFTVLGLINPSRELITDEAERKELLALNLRGGINAKRTSAFPAAVGFLSIAKQLLPANAWQLEPEQTLSVYKELAEACYLAGDFSAADQIYPVAIAAAPTPVDKVGLIMIQATQYQQQGRFEEALPGLLMGLDLLGCPFPETEEAAIEQLPALYEETHKQLNSREECSLIDAKELVLPEHLLEMELYSALTVVLYQLGRFSAYDINSCRMLKLSLSNGVCDLTPLAYLTNAWAMSRMGEPYDKCYQMGKLAMNLTDQRSSRYHRVLIYQGFAAFFQHWGEPLENTFPLLEKAAQWGHEGLNLTSAGHAILLGAMNKVSKGEMLEDVEREAAEGLDFLCRTHQQSTERFIRFGVMQPIYALQGSTESPFSFNTDSVVVTDFFKGDFNTPSMELAVYSHAMIRHAYLMQDEVSQQQFIQNLPIIEACLPHSPALTESMFYTALTWLSSINNNDSKYEQHLSKAKAYARQFKQWAGYCTENFDHLYLLLEAEISRVSESFDKAMPHYNLALDAVEKAGYIQYEALAKELYASFWRSIGQIRVASAFIKEAHRLYSRWGAHAKCDLIVGSWPQIAFRQRDRRTAAYDKALSTAAQHSRAMEETGLLDLHSLLKANQILSEEIKLGSLLKKIMLILLENAGAERGALVLSANGVIEDKSPLVVEVSGKLNDDGCVDCELPGKELVDSETRAPLDLPESIVRYVQQTRTTLLINRPVMDSRFSQSHYLQEMNPQSVLCLPISAQGKLVAIVYLENNLMTNAFTLKHKETLEILSAQVAVSLVNARLYDMVLASLGDADRINVLKTEALEAAESANRLKDEFMSTITHELLTPINGIRLSLSLMKSGVSGEYREFLNTANDSTQQLLNLIESTITFVEARRGTIRLKHVPFDLKRMLSVVFDRFNNQQCSELDAKTVNHQGENVTLFFEWDENAPLWISGDEDKLSTIVAQLVKNACAFTKSGEIRLICSASGDDNARLLKIAVSDTGVGILDEVKHRIFEAFNQADNTMQRQHGGMGIGLTLVKELLHLMGGSLNLESSLGKGATFTLHIPVDVAEPIASEPIPIVPAPKVTSESLKQTKILVVEDNPVNMTLLCKVLEKSDYQPVRAYHGEEALAVLQEDSGIAAVLMDCQMPIMDGYEATRRIRQLDEYKHLPVIAVTANVSEEDQKRCFEAGMSEYLAKPVKRKALESTLIKWLSVPSNHACL